MRTATATSSGRGLVIDADHGDPERHAAVRRDRGRRDGHGTRRHGSRALRDDRATGPLVRFSGYHPGTCRVHSFYACGTDADDRTRRPPAWTPRRSRPPSPTRTPHGRRRGAVRQPRPTRPGRSARTAARRSAVARRSSRTCRTSSGTTGAGSSAHRVNDLAEIEQILNLTDEEREGLSAPDKFRVDITPYFISLIDPNDPNDPIRRQVIPLGSRAGGVHRDDGGLARRGPPLAGARPRPPLPGPGPDAGHDPVRAATAATARGRGSSATRPRTSTAATTRRSSSTCAGRRRSATCSSPAATA